MDLLKEFPALWVVVGGALTGFLFWFLNRNVFSLTQKAQTQLSQTYKEQVEALTLEKEYYRAKTHDQANSLQSDKLRIAELEAKPDLSYIFQKYKEDADVRYRLYEQQSNLLQSLAQLMNDLVNKFTKHEDLLTKLLNRNGLK